MDAFGTPDIPAYVCYLVVVLLGMLAARSLVNRRLSKFRERWGLLSTWGLFWAHSAIPVALFWFLDFSGALHDTSLFAALVVGLGYRKIFSGGVDNIQMPGPTSKLWQPFEAWANQLVESITTLSQSYGDRSEDRVRRYVATDEKRLGNLLALTLFHTKDKDKATLETKLNELTKEATPSGVDDAIYQQLKARRRAKILLGELRAAVPENYGYFLLKQGVMSWWRFAAWFGNARAKGIAWGVTLAVGAGLVLGSYHLSQSKDSHVRYYQWRLLKTHKTERDRYRTLEYFAREMAASNRTGLSARGGSATLLRPLLARLRFKEASMASVEDILRLVEEFHGAEVNCVAIPQLMDSLRTENPDVRLRIQKTLVAVSAADYGGEAPAGEVKDWVPGKDESPAEIDRHVRSWQAWWTTTGAKKCSEAAAQPGKT